MKTSYAFIAIFASLLCSPAATAKLADKRSTVQVETNMQINIEDEIASNITHMLAKVIDSNSQTDAAKQLSIDSLESQTNELIQDVNQSLPSFKFKVVIAD